MKVIIDTDKPIKIKWVKKDCLKETIWQLIKPNFEATITYNKKNDTYKLVIESYFRTKNATLLVVDNIAYTVHLEPYRDSLRIAKAEAKRELERTRKLLTKAAEELQS